MKIYEKLLITYYYYLGRMFPPNKDACVNLLCLIQLAQLCILFAPLRFLGIINGNTPKNYFPYFIGLFIFIFNFFYYNENRFNDLLVFNEKLSKEQKEKDRTVAIAITIATIVGYALTIIYLIN